MDNENLRNTTENTQNAMRKKYSYFAICVIIFAVVATGFQLLGNYVIAPALGVGEKSDWFTFANILIPMHILAFGVLLLITGKQEKTPPEKHELSVGKLLLCIPIMAGLAGVGAIIGAILNFALTLPFGVKPNESTAIAQIMMNSNPVWRIVVVGITAPIVEEMVFRKLLIDRVLKYGELTAILTSGVMFGLFHGNFAQFFFATMIGFFFAYIYIRTGKIWYSMALHACMNLATSVITMWTMQSYLSLDPDLLNRYQEISFKIMSGGGNPEMEQELMTIANQVIPKMGPYLVWTGFMGNLALAGVVLLIIFLVRRKFVLKPTSQQVKSGIKYAWLNPGMLLFLIYCIAEFVMNYIAVIAGASK